MSKSHGPRRHSTVRPQLEVVEDRCVPAGLPISDDSIAVSPDDGGIPRVKIVDPNTGEDLGEIEAYESTFRGGVRTAPGDTTGDGLRDLVNATSNLFSHGTRLNTHFAAFAVGRDHGKPCISDNRRSSFMSCGCSSSTTTFRSSFTNDWIVTNPATLLDIARTMSGPASDTVFPNAFSVRNARTFGTSAANWDGTFVNDVASSPSSGGPGTDAVRLKSAPVSNGGSM